LSQGNIDYGPNFDTYFGAVTVDSTGNMIIGYSYSGPSTFASAVYAVIPSGATMLQDSGLFLAQGAGINTEVDPLVPGTARWGDYSGISLDPADNGSFWVFNEYATSSNSWATTVGGYEAPNSDWTAPAIVNNNLLTIAAGATETITSSSLRADDPDNTHAQLTYTLVGGFGLPQGTLLKNGVATSSFTQDDIDNNRVTYHETANVTRNLTFDSFTFNVSDAVGNHTDVATFRIQISPPPRNDFNQDGKSDLLLQNAPSVGTPDVRVELLNGTTVASSGTITTPLGTTVQAMGDFNHDNKADIIVQTADGTPQIWLMNGTSVTSTVALPNSGTSWHVIATGDFNADGNTDILWQNNDGLPVIWFMNGTSLTGGAVLPNSGPSWHVITTGDFNGDGKSDIIWQNTDGQPFIWEMNGANIIGAGAPPNSGPSWHVIGTGDFNADGKADILWQNDDGLPVIWFMNGTSLTGGAVLPNSGPTWHAIGTSDFNGDAKSDIIWQSTDGLPFIWEMNGASIIGAFALPNAGPTGHVKDDGPISDPAPTPALHLSTPDARSAPDGAAGPSAPYAGFWQQPLTPPDSGLLFASGPDDPGWKLPLHT
jgi:hypothetical protein